METLGRVIQRYVPKYSFRWLGFVDIDTGADIVRLNIPGAFVQWLLDGEEVLIRREGNGVELYRFWEGEKVKVWPPFEKEVQLDKRDPTTGEPLYSYRISIVEATTEREFEQIAELEQYHYASKKETVALWVCPETEEFIESNVKPDCPNAKLVEIKGSLPVSRFLTLKLVDRQPYEPEIVGYVRIDPPIPLMHRRLPDGTVIKNIREQVFPYEWFHPTYWPERLMKELIRKNASYYERRKAFQDVWRKAVEICNTAAARISRVVIHPDYRGDGLGMLAVQSAIEWISERRVPEMKKRKHLVETIAQMARFNPFFERVGFKYLWDTKSGRPVLYYPLTEEARQIIEHFLETDPVAREHGGKLYREAYRPEEPIDAPITLENITKFYESVLDVAGLPPEIQEVLLAFGVDRRRVQKYVLRGANLQINPGDVVAVVGASGAGKTTLLRILAGMDAPDEGTVVIPANARISTLIPWESEPQFEDEPILQHMYEKLGDIVAAIEVLNLSGLGDAVYYRARFSDLSTGQKERAKIASVLADRPNVLIIDEFAAHLDSLTAKRVARKITQIARRYGMTLILVVHRPDVLEVIRPDKIVYVGYGGVLVKERGEEQDAQGL